MYKFTFSLISLFLILGAGMPYFAAAQSATQTRQQLVSQLERYLDDPTNSNAFWGVKIINLQTNETLYERNADRSMLPASNGKLYTTAAALDLLGPDYTYHTRLYTDGQVEGGVLKGNLIVRGAGDPVVGSRFNKQNPTALFKRWADRLQSQGIRRVEGHLVGDDDLFDDQPLGLAWSWDDEPYDYSAEISALTFNDNVVDIVLHGQRFGEPATMHWQPGNTDYVQVLNASQTVHPDSSKRINLSRARNSNRIALNSEIPLGRIDTVHATVPNPTRYFLYIARQTMIEEGLSFSGQIMDIDDMALKPDYQDGSLRLLDDYASPPLQKTISVINKESQNLYAELVLRTLGVVYPTADPDIEPGSAEMGLEAASKTFVKAGIDTSRIHLVDGSGLSRMDLVTPAMTAKLLSYMWNHPDRGVRSTFIASLPVGGVDGTLDRRFRRGLAHGNVRAKTGTLTGVSTLSGYVQTAAGTPLLFVLMCNNHTVKTRVVNYYQNQIVELLAQHQQ